MVSYYRRFLPHCADILQPLSDHLRGRTNSHVELPPDAVAAFEQAKEALASAVMLRHFTVGTPLNLAVDASDAAIGAVLQQFVGDSWQPLAFYPVGYRQWSPAIARSVVSYLLSTRHFRYALEGHEFAIFTDHKPLTYAFHHRSERHSPREVRHLDFVAQFTTDIRHVLARTAL